MKLIIYILILLILSSGITVASEKEQEIALKCIAKGGEASVITTCIASELTKEELKKCLGISDGSCVGKNNEIRKALTNAYNDLTKGPGSNNDINKALKNAEHDLKHGPGPNNDICKHIPLC